MSASGGSQFIATENGRSDATTDAINCVPPVRPMRDSAIPWIGKIPEGWKIWKIGALYTHRNEKVSDRDYPPLSVTMKGILPQLATAAKSDDGDNRKLVLKGDFAINSRSDRRGSCGISEYDGSVSLINTILTPRGEMNPVYYNWLFHTETFADEFYKWGHGIVDDLWTTRWAEMKRMAIPLPPLPEQRAIADYLDGKCAAIDAAVAEAKKGIEEYKVWKKSLIFEIVTGKKRVLSRAEPQSTRVAESFQTGFTGFTGLNARNQTQNNPVNLVNPVKTKPSGIPWIGEIPEGWEVKYLSQSVSQVKNRNDGLKEKNLLSLSYGKIKRKNIDSIGGLLPASFEGYNIIAANDIVLRLTDLQNDQHSLRVGLSHENGIVTSAYTTIRPCDRINAVYLFYSLFAFDIAKGFYGMGAGVRQGLNYDEVKQIKSPLPPLAEQRAIAEYLDGKCAAIDALVAEKEALIADLEAYKKSLIFEVVTGKKEVA